MAQLGRSHGGRPHSIPFIVPTSAEEGAGFTVTKEALEMLGKIKVPVAPIAVVGKYRTGKSFLLNKLLQLQSETDVHGFEVGPTVEACTKGIWLWSEPVPLVLPDGTEYAVLFVDTEGMGAAGSTAEHDARVFSLATLLCSVLLYNSVGAIDEEAVQSLSFVANLTKHIQLRSGAGGAEVAVMEGAALEEAASDESGGDGEDDSDDDDDDDDHGHGAGGKGSKGGKDAKGKGKDSGGDYIGALRRAARKKRAAGKRAQAARLREEARRAAGVRRLNSAGSISGGGGADEGAGASGAGGADGGAGDDREVSSFFPTFLWVLRDFSLELRDDDGSPLSPRDYLEACLQPQGGFSSDVQARNRTRRVLTSFFKERDCATLLRPLDEEAGLQRMDSLPESALRPEFRRQMATLRAHLVNDLARPKTMQGQWVTGRMLAGLAEAYVSAINAHAVPSIGNAWDGVTKVECADAMDAAFRTYSSGFEGEVPRAALPKDEGALAVAHERHRIAALEAYDGRAVGGIADRYRTQLKSRIEAEWKVVRAANAAASETACSRAITRLWTARIEPKLLSSASASSSSAASGSGSASSSGSGSTAGASAAGGHGRRGSGSNSSGVTSSAVYGNHGDFEADLASLSQAYYAEAAGPAVHRVLANFLLASAPTVVRALNRARAAEAEAVTAALTAAVATLRSEIAVARAAAASAEATAESLRGERSAATIEKARAEVEARAAREEAAGAGEALALAQKELVDVRGKLQAERMEHAKTRVALAAAASGSSIGSGSGRVPSTPSAGSGAGAGAGAGTRGSLSPEAEAALQQLATPAPAARHLRVGSVDMRAIMGGSGRGSRSASLGTPSAGSGRGGGSTGASGAGGAAGAEAGEVDVTLSHMVPRGAERIAAPAPREIDFPVATGSSGACAPGGCCVQ